jgi:hypothetical protein
MYLGLRQDKTNQIFLKSTVDLVDTRRAPAATLHTF